MTATGKALPTAPNLIELAIGGMTCASCAARIEKKLNRMDGVEATVNYATEKATVRYADDIAPADLIATVEKTGYTAVVPPPPEQAEAAAAGEPVDELRTARTRLWVSAVLTLPVIVLAMVPAWQFDYWQWASLTLAAPVVVWGGLPFHRAALINLRHGAATMDTLVSLGTLAAFGWSLWALFLGDAGMPGMKHPFSLDITRGDGAGNIYLEAAAGVTVFILAGRYFEARSSAPPGRRCAPCSNSAPRTWRCCATGRRPGSRSAGSRSGTGSWSGPARRSPRTVWSRRVRPQSTPACSPASRCRSRWARATPWSVPR